MESNLRFQTLSPNVSRVVAIITLLIGISGVLYSILEMSFDRYMGGVLGIMFSLIFVVIGFVGPSSVQLFNDKLIVRRGSWKTPFVFGIKEIKEINFTTDKRGRVFSVRTSEKTEVFRFAQHNRIVSEFAQHLEALKVRVSGKR